MQNFEDNILLYIENGLSETDKSAFEAQLQIDANLQESVVQTRKIIALMKQAAKKEKAKAEISHIIEAKKKVVSMPVSIKETKKNNFPRYLSIAASIFLILGLGWWFSQEKDNPYIQHYFVDYVVDTQMGGSDITPFTALSNAYVANDNEVFRASLQNVQPKDTAEFYALYAMKGTMEKRRKLYPDALSSFLTAENYAKTETKKIQTAVNQITLLLATQQSEKARERLKSLLAQIPSSGKNITIEALQKDINNLKD